jgi:DNA-binding winged helix-turn-helix (wHTH) protein
MIPAVPGFRSGIRLHREHSRARTGPPRTISTCVKEFDPFRLDTRNECLWRHSGHGDEERILVKPKAFGILWYLVDHAGCLATQEEILDAIWPNTFVQPEVLKRHIADLREVLGDDPKNPSFIETRPWRGYQFIATVRTTAISPVADIRGQGKPMGSDQALDHSGICTGGASAGHRQNVVFTGTSRDLIAGNHGSTSPDEQWKYQMNKTDLRKEIDRLIQERRSIDRAIADFERLEASLPAKNEFPATNGSENSNTRCEGERKPHSLEKYGDRPGTDDATL